MNRESYTNLKLHMSDTEKVQIRKSTTYKLGLVNKDSKEHIRMEVLGEKNDVTVKNFDKLFNKVEKAETEKAEIDPVDKYFPKTSLESHPPELMKNRIILLLISLLYAFTLMGMKYIISERFDLTTFCDLDYNWKEFDEKVKSGNITLTSDILCEERCDFNNYVYSKVFHLDYYLSYVVTFGLFYSVQNVPQSKCTKLLVYPLIFIFNVISNIIFFTSKLWAFSLGNAFVSIIILLYLLEGKVVFKCLLYFNMPIPFYSAVKFFFEYAFPYVYNIDPGTVSMCLPLITSCFQMIYNFIIHLEFFKRYTATIKMFSSAHIQLVYDYINLGNLHNLVTKGVDYKLFTNLLLILALELNKTFLISKKLVNWGFNLCRKEKKSIVLSDFEKIAIAAKIEIEIYVIGIYFILISFQYFNMSENPLTDCKGRPIKNYASINNNHYVLFCCLSAYLLLKSGVKYLIINILKLAENHGFNPKLEKLNEKLFYIQAFYSTTINFGLPGFYAILYSK